MQSRCCYRGYYLAALSTTTDDGRFQSRVAVFAIDGERTRSQHFVDLEEFDEREVADLRAIEGGKAWIDQQLREHPPFR